MVKLDLTSNAKKIITSNQYLTLSVTTKNGGSWIVPLAYCFDDNFSLYFMSLASSLHCQSIKKDSRVCISIFDSHADFGKGSGLQILGNASLVDKKDNKKIFKLYFKRKWPYGNLLNILEFKHFFTKYNYNFYKIELNEVWITDPTSEYDKRVLVNLA